MKRMIAIICRQVADCSPLQPEFADDDYYSVETDLINGFLSTRVLFEIPDYE